MNVIVGSERPRRNGANYGDEGDARGATREAAEDSDDTADRESTAPGGGQRVALAGTTMVYSPDMSTEGLVEEQTIGENTVWKVIIPCGATGGMHRYASKADAEKQAKINLLSHYPRDDAVWNYACAAELKEEAMACSAAGGVRPPRPRPHGATASYVPGEQLFRSGGRTVRRIQRQEGGVRVSCTYEINSDGAAEVLATASEDLKPHIEQFLGDVAAGESPDDAADVNDYMQEQWFAEVLIDQMRCRTAEERAAAAADEELNDRLRRLSVDCGWFDLTQQEFLPEVDDKTVSYLGSQDCPVYEHVMGAYFGRGSTGPRDSHDGNLQLYRKAISLAHIEGYEEYSGWEVMVLMRVPDLKTRIEGAEDAQTRKAYLKVLDYLVENSAIDHVFSSAVDHPKNCFFGARRRRTRLRLAPVNRPSPRHRRETCSTALRFWTLGRTSLGPRVHWGHVRAEWATVNNYFGGFYNQAAKLFRYGPEVEDESIRWMDECIDAEGKCLA